MDKLKDLFYGCILGGAFGDALGYPVEFLKWNQIRREYGPDGIDYLKLSNGKALISDDTQMTLFTMAGMMTGMARMDDKGIGGNMAAYINMAYCDWLHTQEKDEEYTPFTKQLYSLPEMHAWRAPGMNCMTELKAQMAGSENPPYTNRFADLEHPANENKGCGGVMRVAPVGLMLDESNKRFYQGSAARLGAEAAAITHGHPLGWLSAALLAQIVYECRLRKEKEKLDDVVRRAMKAVSEEFADVPETQELMELCEKAIKLAHGKHSNEANAIHSLGGGWVGEEALAVAIYASVRYQKFFYAGVYTAVNHDGDSDSTGAIAGNILGAYLGFEQMNKSLCAVEIDVMNVELAKEMMELCDGAIDCAFGANRE